MDRTYSLIEKEILKIPQFVSSASLSIACGMTRIDVRYMVHHYNATGAELSTNKSKNHMAEGKY